MHSFNYKIVIFLMGVLLLFNGCLMLISSLVSFFYKDGVTFEITLSSFLVLSLGALLMLFGRQYDKQIQKKRRICDCYSRMDDDDYFRDASLHFH